MSVKWTGSSLVQVMACHLFGAKPLPERMLAYYQLDPWEQLKGNLNQNTKLFIDEDAFQNIFCKVAAILSGGMSKKNAWNSYQSCEPTMHCNLTRILCSFRYSQFMCRVAVTQVLTPSNLTGLIQWNLPEHKCKLFENYREFVFSIDE